MKEGKCETAAERKKNGGKQKRERERAKGWEKWENIEKVIENAYKRWTRTREKIAMKWTEQQQSDTRHSKT